MAEFKQRNLDIRKKPSDAQSNAGADTFLSRGSYRSPGYVKGKSGWNIDSLGNADFRSISVGNKRIGVAPGQSIQKAIDDVAMEGGGIVLLKSGTYNITENIELANGVVLEGDVRDSVIIDGGGLAIAIRSVGTDAYTTGTIAVNDGGTTVTGTSTAWTSAMVGRKIFIGNFYYDISSVNVGAQTLVIAEAYSGNGSNLSGASYAIATPAFNTFIRNITFQNFDGAPLRYQYSTESQTLNCNVYSCGAVVDADRCVFLTLRDVFGFSNENGFLLDDCYSFTIEGSTGSIASAGNGLTVNKGGSAVITNCEFSGNSGDGINFTSVTDCGVINNTCSDNGGQGVELVSGCNDNQFIATTSYGNTSDGYKITATSDRNTISSSSITNNGGYGINIAASSCDGNVVLAPVFSGNSSGEVNDSGTATIRIQESDAPAFSFGGDGSDGAANFNGTNTFSFATKSSNDYTLTRDVYLTNLTIPTGCSLNPGGFRIFGTGEASITGTITVKGGNGGNGSNGATGASGAGGTGGAGGSGGTAAYTTNFFTGPLAGVSGGAGGNGPAFGGGSGGIAGGASAAGTAGTSVSLAPFSITPVAGVQGGAGGIESTSSGQPTSGGAAGAVGAAGTNTTSTTKVSNVHNVHQFRDIDNASTTKLTCFASNGGSSGGGGGATDDDANCGGGGGGGAGGNGANGGICWIAFKRVTVNAGGVITAAGGNGGNGGNGGAASGGGGTAGRGGGGGGGQGGNGGMVVIIAAFYTNSGTVTAAGGTAGTGGATGGTPGNAGSSGSNGNAGADGKIILLSV